MSERLSILIEGLHKILTDKEVPEEQGFRAELDAQLLRIIEADAARRANVPETMICPITFELMQNPVINILSHITYDGNAMNKHVAACRKSGRKITDPFTRQVFDPAKHLVPNKFARDMIEEWTQESCSIKHLPSSTPIPVQTPPYKTIAPPAALPAPPVLTPVPLSTRPVTTETPNRTSPLSWSYFIAPIFPLYTGFHPTGGRTTRFRVGG